ncbi:hypothetical protein ACHAXR_004743 [Thalassiosira sp. AJA248-18]
METSSRQRSGEIVLVFDLGCGQWGCAIGVMDAVRALQLSMGSIVKREGWLSNSMTNDDAWDKAGKLLMMALSRSHVSYEPLLFSW